MTRRTRVSTLRRDTAPATMTVVALAAMMTLTIVSHAGGQPRAPDGDTVIQTSAPGPEAGPQDSFRGRVRDEMADWRRKMQAFDEKMETGGHRHIDAAEKRVRDAWDETEVEARNVQTATALDWTGTKRAYEAASHRMAMAWDKVRL